MIHSLAHALMNQLVYECGYSTAALKERLYVADGDNPMAGLLIYTASGDAEGTMGGLVRMGKPGYLERTLQDALDATRVGALPILCAWSWRTVVDRVRTLAILPLATRVVSCRRRRASSSTVSSTAAS